MQLFSECVNFENAFLYAFSTIPQVIAAVIALLAVFLLFKIQSIKNSILGFGRQTLDYFVNEPKLSAIEGKEINKYLKRLKHGITREDLETTASQVSGLITEMDEKIKNAGEIRGKNKINAILNTIKHNNKIQFNCLEVQKKITQKSKKILIHTILIITISILLIPFVPILNSTFDPTLLFSLFIIVVIWLTYLLKMVYEVISIAFIRNY